MLYLKLSWPPNHFQTQIMFLTPSINFRSNKANQDDQEVIQDDQEVIQIDQEVRLRDRGCNITVQVDNLQQRHQFVMVLEPALENVVTLCLQLAEDYVNAEPDI